jgi:hypothetical protein
MRNLAGLYDSAEPPVKRGIVVNCISNRTWNGSCVELWPSEQFVRAETDPLAPSGEGIRDTFRTFIEIFDIVDEREQIDDMV